MQKKLALLGSSAWPSGRSASAPPSDVPEWMQVALDWLSHTDRLAALVAFFALVVAVWSAAITRRGVRAADRSAHAAEAQAEAAAAQAFDASSQASTARVTAEVEALAAAKGRIDAASPSVVVAITNIDHTPHIAENLYDIQCPHPKTTKVEGNRYVKWADWHFDVYFVITGTLFNDGAQAVRVYTNGPRFYRGKHPLTGEDLAEPHVCDPAWDARVLYPGQFASFQIFVGQQVWDWLHAFDSKPEGSESELRDSFTFRPGGWDEPSTSVTIRTRSNPLVRVTPEHADARVGDLKARVRPSCPVNVHLDHFREYPESLDQVHAELRNDQDEVRSLYWRSQMARSLREERERKAAEERLNDDDDSASAKSVE
ncbi:hypothetical protein [Micromonospora chersina]|uniref:hypothetical protein n=1 Tax=Micromonospora chersina TaxID=47854 RepID=UPI00368AA8B4